MYVMRQRLDRNTNVLDLFYSRANTAGKEIGCYKRKSADKSNSLKKPLALTTCAEAEVIWTKM